MKILFEKYQVIVFDLENKSFVIHKKTMLKILERPKIQEKLKLWCTNASIPQLAYNRKQLRLKVERYLGEFIRNIIN